MSWKMAASTKFKIRFILIVNLKKIDEIKFYLAFFKHGQCGLMRVNRCVDSFVFYFKKNFQHLKTLKYLIIKIRNDLKRSKTIVFSRSFLHRFHGLAYIFYQGQNLWCTESKTKCKGRYFAWSLTFDDRRIELKEFLILKCEVRVNGINFNTTKENATLQNLNLNFKLRL